MNRQQLQKSNLPDKPGIYIFRKGKTILYIGKATSLRDRTKSYFSRDLIVTRGPMILDMVVQADNVKWQETDSVLEALILEASLIKKHLPKYNVKEKDDKSWNYVCFTKEKVPKVVIIRGKELKNIKNFGKTFGPYTNGLQLREALRIIRRIFPYVDGDSIKKNNREFYKQLGLTPDGTVEYKNNIKNLKLFFQGKKKKIIQNLKKEMTAYAKVHNFEKAGETKNKIFALNHINDIALIKNDMRVEESSFKGSLSGLASPALPLGSSACETPFKRNSSTRIKALKESSFARTEAYRESFSIRIEAYDIAHMSGKNMVGVMTVIENGEVVKSEYKKFIIRTQTGANDTGALSEVLLRRLRHTEWGIPNLIVVDGNIAQINTTKRALSQFQFKIEVVGVVKDEHHKAKAIMGNEKIISKYKKLILLANSEAHRFAIKFYREKSRKNMFK